MTFKELRDHCLSLPGGEETFPFGEDVLVFKVAGRMFALTAIDRLPLCVSLKCDPDRADELRERYPGVRPGYHMNKRHWNTIELESDIPTHEIRGWIEDSYRLVVRGLRRADREALASSVGR